MSFVCKYCQKSYVKESSLFAHMCEPKRRWQQQNEQSVQIGFKSYLRFYEITQSSSRIKTYEDFSNSPYYNAFVRYGRYCMSIRCVNVARFTDWLLANNKKLDYWCKDSVYSEWLNQYLRKEAVQDAIERAIKEMQKYADTNENLKNNFSNYFKFGSSNRICQHISDRRISPWVVFNCKSGISWLEQINQEQLEMILPIIDPDFWQRKFKDYVSDTAWCKDILQKSGL